MSAWRSVTNVSSLKLYINSDFGSDFDMFFYCTPYVAIKPKSKRRAGKSKLKSSIHSLDVTPNETTQLLREMITDLIKKSWNPTRFMEAGSKATRQRNLRKMWAADRLTEFDPKEGPTVNFN